MTEPSEHIPQWELYLAWLLKVVILLTSLAQFARGEWVFGIGVLVAASLASLPAYLSQNNKYPFPVEIEILLSLILVVHLTFGLALDFYNTFDHYDKVLHYGNSILISFIGFLIAYALHFTGRLHTSAWGIVIVILLITLGIGAFWEIMEYASDQLVYGNISAVQKQQGSPTSDPLDDTMLDLVGDLAGGVIGAFLGGLYIRYSKRTRSRRFVEVMEALSEASAMDEPVEWEVDEGINMEVGQDDGETTVS